MNKKLIASALVIGVTGVINGMIKGTGLTRPILGTYVLIFALAILDMFGGEFSPFASALAMVAALYVLITEFPWQTLLQAIGA